MRESYNNAKKNKKSEGFQLVYSIVKFSVTGWGQVTNAIF